jgi:hypothetical protein
MSPNAAQHDSVSLALARNATPEVQRTEIPYAELAFSINQYSFRVMQNSTAPKSARSRQPIVIGHKKRVPSGTLFNGVCATLITGIQDIC